MRIQWKKYQLSISIHPPTRQCLLVTLPVFANHLYFVLLQGLIQFLSSCKQEYFGIFATSVPSYQKCSWHAVLSNYKLSSALAFFLLKKISNKRLLFGFSTPLSKTWRPSAVHLGKQTVDWIQILTRCILCRKSSGFVLIIDPWENSSFEYIRPEFNLSYKVWLSAYFWKSVTDAAWDFELNGGSCLLWG